MSVYVGMARSATLWKDTFNPKKTTAAFNARACFVDGAVGSHAANSLTAHTKLMPYDFFVVSTAALSIAAAHHETYMIGPSKGCFGDLVHLY